MIKSMLDENEIDIVIKSMFDENEMRKTMEHVCEICGEKNSHIEYSINDGKCFNCSAPLK